MNNFSGEQGTNTEHSHLILEEHRLLADRIEHASHVIDLFFTATANREALDVRRIVVLLEELRQIAETHFRHEEALMTKNNFPGFMFHKRDHDYLIKNLISFTSSLSHGTVPFAPDTGVNLRSWLTYHIKKYDDVYAGFMESGTFEGHD